MNGAHTYNTLPGDITETDRDAQRILRLTSNAILDNNAYTDNIIV